jgi:subtilisin-like proprotein convertase family protein
VSNFQYILTQDGNKYPIYGVPQPGRYRPTQNPGFPPVLNAPAPAGPYGQTLDTFKGTSANGVWSLYIADNNNSDSGSLSGWSLIIDEAKSFGNDRSVTIPGGAPGTTSGPAEVYPSTVLVDGLEGQVRSVRVMLTALTHTYQADVRMMLQSPGGQTCLFYGNCGDSTNWTASDVIFDDTAATAMPSNLPVAPGVYRPTVCTNAGVNFAAPAPAAPYGTTLSVFNGSNPNGAWRLWIEDSYNNDYGALTGGWSLIINGQTCPADYNKDGVIGIQDIFDFLNGWFAGCP